MLKSLKVATPLTALTGLEPASVPPTGLVPIASVIGTVEEVTVFPPASCTITVAAGDIVAPAVALVGCWRNASLVAGPRVILKVLLVAAVRLPLVALRVYPVPVLLTLKSLNVATPLTALMIVVPDSVPLPGLVPMATVIEAVEEVTVFPPASCTTTVTTGDMSTPAAALLGCWPKTNWVAGPAATFSLPGEVVK
jgi:hypothetical protein